MKQIFVFFALLISFNGFTQTFSLNELVNIRNIKNNDFDTFILRKGFVFFEESKSNVLYETVYTKVYNEKNRVFISRTQPINCEECTLLEVRTSNTDFYLKIKDELKFNKYSEVKRVPNQSFNHFGFSKGNIEVNLSSYYGVNNNDIIYSIQISNK